MAGNIINLIRKDFYALWTAEKGVGVALFLPIIVFFPTAPVWKFFPLIYMLIILYTFGMNSFMLEEKYITSRFFASLAVQRREIVLSKYLGIAVIMAVHLVLAYSANFVFFFAGKLKYQLPPGYFALILFVASLLISTSFPVYFRYGITKSMYIIAALFMGLFLGIMFVLLKKEALFKEIIDFSFTNVFTTSLLLTGMAVLLFVISIRISSAIYLKRDI
ncbi:MAG: ABC-2 transporter permease [Deltaproteobacteria bacterium]|nr:ABC-2 transporter permease [Deltaproteobacteria bacterium]